MWLVGLYGAGKTHLVGMSGTGGKFGYKIDGTGLNNVYVNPPLGTHLEMQALTFVKKEHSWLTVLISMLTLLLSLSISPHLQEQRLPRR